MLYTLSLFLFIVLHFASLNICWKPVCIPYLQKQNCWWQNFKLITKKNRDLFVTGLSCKREHWTQNGFHFWKVTNALLLSLLSRPAIKPFSCSLLPESDPLHTIFGQPLICPLDGERKQPKPASVLLALFSWGNLEQLPFHFPKLICLHIKRYCLTRVGVASSFSCQRHVMPLFTTPLESKSLEKVPFLCYETRSLTFIFLFIFSLSVPARTGFSAFQEVDPQRHQKWQHPSWPGWICHTG